MREALCRDCDLVGIDPDDALDDGVDELLRVLDEAATSRTSMDELTEAARTKIPTPAQRAMLEMLAGESDAQGGFTDAGRAALARAKANAEAVAVSGSARDA